MSKITIVTGPYGVGKSEFAVQLAIYLQNTQNYNISLADLDVVNVYFRSREAAKVLSEHGISVLGNVLGDDVNTDVPHLSANFYSVLQDVNSHLIIDLAGSDVGLRMIPAFLEDLVKQNNGEYELLYVVNAMRSGCESAELIKQNIDFVNGYSDLEVTGFVNNTNLLNFTTQEEILTGQKLIEESKVDLEIKYTMLLDKFSNTNISGEILLLSNIFLKNEWK